MSRAHLSERYLALLPLGSGSRWELGHATGGIVQCSSPLTRRTLAVGDCFRDGFVTVAVGVVVVVGASGIRAEPVPPVEAEPAPADPNGPAVFSTHDVEIASACDAERKTLSATFQWVARYDPAGGDVE